MSLRKYARPCEFASMLLMVLGIVALCQPWSLLLHEYSVAIVIAGLLAFNVFSRIASPPPEPGEAPSGTR